ncbi:ABC transporter permease [Streptomyces sp. cg35]|uniref:ABC transporter permease n=1 Tax=Streptomyces sp. cg35 TaxID=3421650 RepID=UPI003D176707
MPTALTRPALRGPLVIVERNVMIYRHTWLVLVSEIFEPALYLFAFGLGIGALVGEVPGLGSSGVSHPAFVAPALLATAAMNGAMNETSFTMFGKLRTDRTYESVLTTPVTVRDVALGEVAWALIRGGVVAVGFLGVVAATGLVVSPWIVLAVPGALLVGYAFASLGLLVVTLLRTWQDFQYIQLAMLPMFLFATTFYPLDVYPQAVRSLVVCLPLYQSIELLRRPALGDPGADLLLPALYLLLLGTAALLLAVRRLERTLRP